MINKRPSGKSGGFKSKFRNTYAYRKVFNPSFYIQRVVWCKHDTSSQFPSQDEGPHWHRSFSRLQLSHPKGRLQHVGIRRIPEVDQQTMTFKCSTKTLNGLICLISFSKSTSNNNWRSVFCTDLTILGPRGGMPSVPIDQAKVQLAAHHLAALQLSLPSGNQMLYMNNWDALSFTASALGFQVLRALECVGLFWKVWLLNLSWETGHPISMKAIFFQHVSARIPWLKKQQPG